MNPVNQDEQCQSGAFVPPYYLPGHQQTSHNQSYGPVQFLSEGTQNLPSMTMTSTNTSQPQTGGLQYYSGTLGGLQPCFNPNPNPSPNSNANPLTAGPVRLVHVGAQHLVPQTLQPMQMPSGYNRAVLVGQQMMRNPTVSGFTSDPTACQMPKPISKLPEAVTAASAHSSKPNIDDVLQKREVRLMKNREAVREYRRKEKEYVKCLKNRVTKLEDQNKSLTEELSTLKDTYQHKEE